MKKIKKKNIVISNDFIKYQTNKQVLIVKNFIPEMECEKILKNLKKNRKTYISLKENIKPGKTKDWKRIDKLNNKSKILGRSRCRENYSSNLWTKEKNGEKKYLRLIEKKIQKVKKHKKENLYKINKKLFVQGYIFRYLNGSGEQKVHTDNVDGIRNLTAITILSKPGQDYKLGGLIIYVQNEFINIEKYLSQGDLILFSGKMKHKVLKLPKHRGRGRYILMNSVQRIYG